MVGDPSEGRFLQAIDGHYNCFSDPLGLHSYLRVHLREGRSDRLLIKWPGELRLDPAA